MSQAVRRDIICEAPHNRAVIEIEDTVECRNPNARILAVPKLGQKCPEIGCSTKLGHYGYKGVIKN